jgi:PBSX family phage terminase large subunit
MLDCPWGEPGRKGLDFICRSNATANIAVGAVRSGKTVSKYMRLIDYIGRGPKGPIGLIGKTERTLKRNIIDPLTEALGSDRVKIVWGQKGEGHILGRKVYVYGANNEQAAGKIQGVTLAGAFGDEIVLWPESFYNMMMSRLSIKGSKFFGTTNPGPPTHWLKKIINRRELIRSGDLKVWNFLLSDNRFLDPEVVERLKRNYVGLWYKRFILGQWCAAEGAIYDFFDEKKHCWTDDPGFNIARRYVSVDYGTVNPTTFGMYGVNKYGAPTPKAALESEYYYDSKAPENYGRQKTDGQYADDFVEFVGTANIEEVIIDPSAASFIAELENRGFRVRLAKNDVSNGIRTEAEFLEHGKFRVHESCEKTIDETSGYVWDDKAAARGEDKPLKVNDHCPDRDRYFLYTLFGKPLNEKVAAVYNV